MEKVERLEGGDDMRKNSGGGRSRIPRVKR